MTFSHAPLAVDGALLPSRLFRRAQFVATSGAEGIAQRGDLKARALPVPGRGLIISAGNAVLLNRYQTGINESYTVANPDDHEMTAVEMPAAQPSAKSYLVCVTVGDPEFDQVGHPWMPSTDLAEGEAEDYQYVRPWLVECPSTTTKFSQLGLAYPAYAVARLDIPANTTTVTDVMFKDLRNIARPRAQEETSYVNLATGAADSLSAVLPAFEYWISNGPTLEIPSWASIARIDGWIESVVITKAVNSRIRVAVNGTSLATDQVPINRSAPTSGSDRIGANFGGVIDVSSVAGTTKQFRLEGTNFSTASKDGLAGDEWTSSHMRIRFEEAAS